MEQTEKSSDSGRRPGWLSRLKELLGQHWKDVGEIPSEPEAAVVTSLIERASGERVNEAVPSAGDESVERDEKGGEDAPEQKKGCPYAMKRNIVASLHEIRRFAEENDLAAAMVKAILNLLAEMALGALKGKVSGTVLAVLLNALNYERDKEEAYRRGEVDGRNARITTEYFAEGDDGLPHLKGVARQRERGEDIFSMARDARSRE